MTKPRIFLTGANGFLGAAIRRKLARAGYTIVCGGRTMPEGFEGAFLPFDLTDSQGVKAAFGPDLCFDIVIHAAGSLRARCHEVNHLGTRNLLRSLQGRNTRWIQMSSAGVYQNSYHGVIRETTAYEPKTEYEQSKLRADEEVLANSTNCILLRPSMVAGQGMKGRPLQNLARFLELGLKPDFNDKHILNLLHVDDVAEAVLHFCDLSRESPKDSAFLLSDDLAFSEVIRLLEGGKGRKGLTLSPRWIRGLARVTSAIGMESFNRGTVSRMFNEARISSALFRALLPGWPQVGSSQAICEFAGLQKKTFHSY